MEVDTKDNVEHNVEEEEQIVQDNTQKEEEVPSNPMQQQGSQLRGKEVVDNKRTHVSEGLESDKDSPKNIIDNQLSIVTTTPNTGGWCKVEKKKGRKQ